MLRLVRGTAFMALVIVLFQVILIHGQGESLGLVLSTEVNIGFDCPISATSDGSTVWVLADNCGGFPQMLHAYDLQTGENLRDIPIRLEGVDGIMLFVDNATNPLALTPDGQIEILVSDYDISEFRRYLVDMDTGNVSMDPDADAQLNDLLTQFSPDPVFQVTFSPDHRYAVASDDVAMHLLDLSTGEALFSVDVAYGFAAFSPDAQYLYISVLDEPDNYDVSDATTTVYSVPDGEAIQSLAVPSFILYPSPDGQYLAFQTAPGEIGTEEIGFVDVATGRISPLLKISVGPGRALVCANTGRDLSDVDFLISGYLSLRAAYWLPDMSGFVTFNAYDGNATNTGCIFEYSRWRQYSIAGV